jgi:hypothetical protein
MAEPLDQPLVVVALLESQQCVAQLFHGNKGLHPQKLFLEGTDEAFGAAVALRLPDEGRAGCHAQEAQFTLEVVAHILAAVIVTDSEHLGDPSRVATEMHPQPLTQRLQGFESGAASGGMDADTFGGVMVDGDEDGGGALGCGQITRGVRPPYIIGALSDDRAVVRLWPMYVAAVTPSSRERMSSSSPRRRRRVASVLRREEKRPCSLSELRPVSAPLCHGLGTGQSNLRVDWIGPESPPENPP